MDKRTISIKKLEGYMKLIQIRIKEKYNIQKELNKYKNNKKKHDELKNLSINKSKEIEELNLKIQKETEKLKRLGEKPTAKATTGS